MQRQHGNYLGSRPKNSLLSSTGSNLVWRGKEIKDLTEINLNDNSTPTQPTTCNFTHRMSGSFLFNLFKQGGGVMDLKVKENVPEKDSGRNRNTSLDLSPQKQKSYPRGKTQPSDSVDSKNPYQISMPPAAYFREDRPIPAPQFCQSTVNCQRRASEIKAPQQAHSINGHLSIKDDKAQERVVARKLIKAYLEHLFTENRILENELLRRKINTTNGGIALSILVKETRLLEYCNSEETVLKVINNSCDHFLEVLFEEKIYLRPKDWLTIVVSVN